MMFQNRFNAINKYRVERWCYQHHLEPIARLIRAWIYLIHNSFIPYKCEIGEGTIFGYKGMAVVIHSDAKIGKDCLIGTCVTIGGRERSNSKILHDFDDRRSTVPVIGDRVHIANGAKIIGNIVIGDDVIVGANAVVISDVPSRSVVGGVPSRILRMRTDEEIASQLSKMKGTS